MGRLSPFTVLIDSGSIHNFLDLGVLQKIVKVTVANGAKVVSEGKVTETPFSIQGSKFSTEVHVINLASYDMVLGVFWLQTLGSIQWNFQDLNKRFMQNNQEVVLRGHSTRKFIEEWGLPNSREQGYSTPFVAGRTA